MVARLPVVCPTALTKGSLAAFSTGKRCAVIGVAISGVQAMKACLAEGIEPVGFESDEDIGGFWRYKEAAEHPSVYRSTHIDSDKDLNSFGTAPPAPNNTRAHFHPACGSSGDFPWDADAPLLIHNTELTRYLRQNIEEFDLGRRINYSTRVSLVTPVEVEDGGNVWDVTYSTTSGGEAKEVTETITKSLNCGG